MLNTGDVRKFLSVREVDLYIEPPAENYELCLHGRFLDDGDFFRLLVRDVSYVELMGGFTVGDVLMTDVAALSTLIPRWKRLQHHEGTALAFRSGNSVSWGPESNGYVIIAAHFHWQKGTDWDRVLAHRNAP